MGAEQEKKLNQAKKEEEEKLRKEEADKRAAEAEEKKKRLEEAEAKRQEMLDAQKADKAGAAAKKSTAGTEGNDARKEMTKTKEQLEEEKKIALSIRIKPLELDAMDTDDLKAKATELFNIVIQLETDKYDYEQKRQQQERDLQELKERQKAQLRKKLYEGGWEVIRAESLDAIWKEKFDEWSKRPSKKLPKWFGERPGKKAGDAPTPEGEEDGGEEAAAEEEYDEEEEEEE